MSQNGVQGARISGRSSSFRDVYDHSVRGTPEGIHVKICESEFWAVNFEIKSFEIFVMGVG